MPPKKTCFMCKHKGKSCPNRLRRIANLFRRQKNVDACKRWEFVGIIFAITMANGLLAEIPFMKALSIFPSDTAERNSKNGQ